MNPRAMFLADQADAAHHEHLVHVQAIAADGRAHLATAPASAWMLTLVERVSAGPPRYTRCRHLRGVAAPQPVYLQAHRRRLECLRCHTLSVKSLTGTREERSCDACRRLIPRGEVLTAGILIGTVMVFAGHCHDCTPVVRGEPAPVRSTPVDAHP